MKKQSETILLLPLDERPCNYLYPALLADAADCRLLLPARDKLGKKKTPADAQYIRNFLLENAAQADAAVVSIDMLLYGGLLPGRLHTDSADALAPRLEILGEMKRRNPQLTIYAFHLVMRCPQYSSSDEEPDYYETCGREIFLLGEALDKQRHGLPVDEAAVTACRQKTAGALDDYLTRRKTNVTMNMRTIDSVGDVIDYLIIPQDDSAVYGFTAVDQRAVRDYVRKHNKQLRVAIYPSADEVGMTLVSRAVLARRSRRPSVFITYSSIAAPFCVPKYEDRMLGESVKSQVAACGCAVTTDKQAADFILAVNAPAGNMREADRWQEGGAEYNVNRNLPLFVETIIDDLRAGRRVAVADVAYSNGGDLELAALLDTAEIAQKICAYGGWNTAGNTLGSVIAAAALSVVCGRNEKAERFTALRYFEDVGYCTHTRRYVTDRLGEYGCTYFDLQDKGAAVAEFVRNETQSFLEALMPSVAAKYRIAACVMPWNRMFETEFTIDVRA